MPVLTEPPLDRSLTLSLVYERHEYLTLPIGSCLVLVGAEW